MLVFLMASQFIWTSSQGVYMLMALSMAVLGIGSFSSNSSQQVRLATLAPELASVTIAFNSSAVYIGQAVGTSVASVILARMSGAEAYAALGWGAASMTLLAMAVSWFASVRSRHLAGA